jgi:hypothetical protein
MVENFAIDADLVEAAPYGSGHIHDTFLAVYRNGERLSRFIHQRLNRRVFPRPDVVMRNIAAVTRHVRRRLVAEATDDLDRRVLTLVPTRDGSDYTVDAEGDWWRTYIFIGGARSIDTAEAPAQAFQAARAFGDFQRLLLDYDGPEVAETIPRFHDTRRRFEAFRRALAANAAGRASAATDEVRFALAHEGIVDRLLDLLASGQARTRLTHNDTKLNNVLLDDTTGEGLCVIDLDTVMPGSALTDFGDLARSGATRAAEDERDLTRVRLELDLFAALTEGFVRGAGASLSASERAELPFGALLRTVVDGLRFLADHLRGDTYFRVHRENQNLDRARTHFALALDYDRKQDELAAIAAASAMR